MKQPDPTDAGKVMILRKATPKPSGELAKLFDPLATPAARDMAALPSLRAMHDSAWHGHVSFAHWLVQATRPSRVVELGTQRGVSYMAFCQAVDVLGLGTSCTAVDTWEGDLQTGVYSNEIFDELDGFNSRRYAKFSTLLRCYFEDALSQFLDHSIDILHLDGLHTYEATRHDFETWLPKMSDQGVVLFHDIAVRADGFGVWQLWDELSPRYPAFAFMHSAGLGVLAVGRNVAAEVLSLCGVQADSCVDRLRRQFEVLSEQAQDFGKSAARSGKREIGATSTSLSNTDAVMKGWALEQIYPWLLEPVPTDSLWNALELLNATDPNVYVLTIREGRTVIAEKSEAARGPNFTHNYDRANCYRQYFDMVAKLLPPSFETRVAVFVDDGAMKDPKVPVFSFQKPIGNKSILLPDPDMLGRGHPVADDVLAFEEKKCRAIFAGATSGGTSPLTTEAVRRDGAIPRIRAAEFFRNVDDVIFKIPNLVQYDSEETADLLRSMGYGDSAMVSWREQLENKFVISMDGNGATCTRVSITLSSNSVLLKYDSPSILYYFSGLIPWVHYVPVSSHKSIQCILDIERESPGYFSFLPTRAKEFAGDFLTGEATTRYTAFLLALYAGKLASVPLGNATQQSNGLGIVTHVEGLGDICTPPDAWAGVPGSGASMEGFTIWPSGVLGLQDISYQALGPDGTATALVQAGCFCGTVGKSRPIYGLRIQLSAAASRRWQLKGQIRLVDGQEIALLGGADLATGPWAEPLESFRIMLEE